MVNLYFMQRILISWVGKADITGATNEPATGPLARILAERNYDALLLLRNYSAEEVEPFLKFLNTSFGGDVKTIPAKLPSPIHFGEIYRFVNSVVRDTLKTYPQAELTLQLSSGTPAMIAVSILIGKTLYPAQFIQSSFEKGVEDVELPFDIAAEFIPSLKEQWDKSLASIMAGLAPDTAAFDDIITQNPTLEMLKQQAAILAKRNVPVLIYGETGTGKELFARAIRNSSDRSKKPFKVLNCGAVPPELIDTTLFGHTKGAFTGANQARKGYFEEANGGTLFLDEFGELPLPAQVRLLRVLQEKKLTPVGSTKEIEVDVRLITATNKNLVEEIAAGRFREDLFYRVAIGVLHLPPLRERQGDLSLLADKLLEQINKESVLQPGYEHKKLSAKAKNIILKHSWPGNVRELNATLLRATLWRSGKTISDLDIKSAMLQAVPDTQGILDRPIKQGFDINEVIEEVSAHYIERALAEAHGNKTKAANMLGLKNYQTLNNWMAKYSIK